MERITSAHVTTNAQGAIHVIGSSGFIGKAIEKIASKTHNKRFHFYSSNPTNNDNRFIKLFDLNTPTSWGNLNPKEDDKILFLSWPGLPNYDKSFHVTEILPKATTFIEFLEKTQTFRRLIVAGTCAEYGLASGEMKEDAMTEPSNFYGIAKDCLRKASDQIFKNSEKDLVWTRIFFPYGNGHRNPNSLFNVVNQAIKNKVESIDVSTCDQIRDFIKVEDVANHLVAIAESGFSEKLINIGSGSPTTIRDFLEDYIESQNSKLKLNLGAIPKRLDEPQAFWANIDRLNRTIKSKHGESKH